MKKSKRSTGTNRNLALAVIAVIAAAAWLYLDRGGLKDDSRLSGKFDSQVNEVLTRHGIDDTHIHKTIRREMKRFFPIPTVWVETEREISLSDDGQVQALTADIEKVASQLKLRILPSSEVTWVNDDADGGKRPVDDNRVRRTKRTVLEFGRKDRVFQRLILLPPAEASGRPETYIAIVIDDIAGRPSDLETLEQFFDLGIPVTYAILPAEKQSRQAAEKVHGSGNEIIVHQPMEPEDIANNDPGSAALLVRMSRREISKTLEENFENVPHTVGVSNHMGSLFTADELAMTAFFQSLKKMKVQGKDRSPFFFDSYTNARSLGLSKGDEAGVDVLQNDIFLDNEDDPDVIAKQLDELRDLAMELGAVTAVGHIQREHLIAALRNAIPRFRDEGISFVHLSRIVHYKKSRSKALLRSQGRSSGRASILTADSR